MKKVKFIHAADLHLDSPMIGLKHLPKDILNRLRESTFVALKKITAAALEHTVDFVILAGDLFDGEDRSIRAQARLRSEMEKLHHANIPVFVVHGNHDHMSGSWVKLDMPENVYVFGSEVEVKVHTTSSGEKIHLYGFSYEQRHVIDRKINDYIRKDGADYHVGILHGHDGGNSSHGVYAPFNIKELLDKRFNYWALGHIHKRALLSESPPVVYPGNIQGRHRKETGQKGCYVVTLSELGQQLQFIETADVIWNDTIIDASGLNKFQEIFITCREEIEMHRSPNQATLLHVKLDNLELDAELSGNLILELLEALQDEEKDVQSFVWVTDIQIQTTRKPYAEEGGFIGDLILQAKEIEDVEHVLRALFDDHHLGRKYLTGLSVDEQQELIYKAQNLLVDLLHPSQSARE